MEALSYGLSCLVSDIPANREVGLEENRYFKSGKVQALAVKLDEYMAKPLLQIERIAEIELVAKKYDWDGIAQKTLEVYKSVN